MVLGRLRGALFGAWRDHEFKILSYFVIFALAGGMLFYHGVEDWRFLDAFYFSAMTLTTVGYGDFAPATDTGKIFTVFFIFIGLGILLSFVNVVAKHALKFQTDYSKRMEKLESKRFYASKKKESFLSRKR